MRIPEDKIELVRASTDIVPVVQGYVSLKKRGQNYFGLCPFHGENTPSFSVHPGKQIFRCFGCGKGGNVFAFLMEAERITFTEAVRLLAEKAGIALPDTRDESSEEESESALLVKVNGFARDFFYQQLTEGRDEGARAAREYLKARGYGKAVIDRFLLGYGPDGWEGLANKARDAGLPLSVLVQAGLLKEGKENNKPYDAFRHRIMFPIRNLAGRVIAFGGRRLREEETAKYINSPETAIYRKGRELFGLWEARNEIRTRDQAILVEGYTDCLSLVMAGVPVTVASLGTALTEQQARLLKRFTSRIYVLYDGDSAGKAAAKRALDVLLGVGAAPRAILLPEGEDPDSYVRKHGGEAIWKCLNESSYSPVEFQLLLAGKNRASRTTAAKELVASAALITSPIEQDLFLQEVSARTGVSVDTLRQEMAQSGLRTQRAPEASTPDWPPAGPLSSLAGALIRHPVLRAEIFSQWSGVKIEDATLRGLFRALYEEWRSGEERAPETLLDRFPNPPLSDFITGCLYLNDIEEDTDKALEIDRRVAMDCLHALEADLIRKELTELKQQLSQSTDGGSRELLEKLNGLMRREKELRAAAKTSYS